MSHQKDFYTAKEKLGLLSLGDPGAGDKVQVSDTYLISIARKLDNKVKQHPDVKRKLIKLRSGVRKVKGKLQKSYNNQPVSGTPTHTEAVDMDKFLADTSLPVSKKPQVSIIIPAFNKCEMTAKCLESLSKLNRTEIPFQVILVDNGSSDETPAFAKLRGLTYLRNEDNLGFVGGCNSGISEALGEYIVFLNNDTEVDTAWLKTLFDTISNDDTIGLAGSKIIYPDGRLQEAGGIIFKDGTGLNYGKFDQAEAYQYNYVRDVDYCSGASIIIKKSLLESFGGFDTLYQPAYYEDTDLSFKVRQAGLRVVYQPLSVIYHIEGGTAGTNLNTGFKRYQEINREKFLKRWSKTLKSSHVDSSDYYLGRDRSGDKLALILEESLPSPDKDSGSVRMMAMIKSLQSLGYKVTFWPNDLKPTEPYVSTMQQMGVEVVYGNVDFMQFSKHFAHHYDMVIMSRPEICARYINICRSLFTNATLIYDTVDLHYVRLARQAEVEKANAEALLEQSKWYRILELGLMERADVTLVVSDKEVEILKDEGVNADVQIVSNIHTIDDSSYDTGFDGRKDILFVGNYAHLPNRDAIGWFVNDIFPAIKKKLPNAKLHVVGANMPSEIASMLAGKKGVVTHGFVDDATLINLVRESRVFVAPLRYGAGVKGKIGQAIEHGLPVVSTSIGAEGMYLEDGISCLVGDEAESFAQKTIDLYSDKKLWEKLQANARRALEEHFSIELATKSLAKVLGK